MSPGLESRVLDLWIQSGCHMQHRDILHIRIEGYYYDKNQIFVATWVRARGGEINCLLAGKVSITALLPR
jgi:hypothetical protein